VAKLQNSKKRVVVQSMINRHCPTCNRLCTTEKFSPSLAQCPTCSKMGTKKKPSQFKLQNNEVGLIFRSALPEELEWDTRAEDVALSLDAIALSLDAIKRCLSNMLVALDRDLPQTKIGLALPRSQSSTRNRHGSGSRSRNWDSLCSRTKIADQYTQK